MNMTSNHPSGAAPVQPRFARGEKSWDQRKCFHFLLDLIRAEKFKLGIALLLAMMASLAALLPFGILYLAIDAVLQLENPSDRLSQLAGWMALVLLLKYALYSGAYYISHRCAFALLAQIRETLVKRLNHLPLLQLGRFSSAQLKTLIMQDVERIEKFIAHHLIEMAAAIFSPLAMGILLFFLDWRLAIAALAVLPMSYLSQSFFMREMTLRYQDFARAEADLNTASVEYIRNIAVMKAFSQDSVSFQRLRQALDRHHQLISRVIDKTVPAWSIFMVMLSANVFFMLPIGVWLLQTGEISLSQLILSLILGSGMLQPLFKVIRFSAEIKEILVGVERMGQLLEPIPKPVPEPVQKLQKSDTGDSRKHTQPVDKAVEVPIDPSSVEIRFEQIAFAYQQYHDKQSHPLFQQFNFCLTPGQTIALVGPSGAGKSSLVSLLTGLIPPQSGQIYLNKTPLSQLDDQQRARYIAMAGQESWLFKGSIRDNLLMAAPGASEQQIRKVLKVAGLESLILSLPQQLETPLDERGVRLSGGERQRLCIARALLADTPVLVLDEVTAFADSVTEKTFFQELFTHYGHKTLLIVAHRLYAIKNADCIVVMDQGAIVDRGRHESLLVRCHIYRQLWEQQQLSQSWQLGQTQTACLGPNDVADKTEKGWGNHVD